MQQRQRGRRQTAREQKQQKQQPTQPLAQQMADARRTARVVDAWLGLLDQLRILGETAAHLGSDAEQQQERNGMAVAATTLPAVDDLDGIAWWTWGILDRVLAGAPPAVRAAYETHLAALTKQQQQK